MDVEDGLVWRMMTTMNEYSRISDGNRKKYDGVENDW